MHDLIIIGAGPAGLSALLWCDDLGLRALLLERRARTGGQLDWIHNRIANHLGTLGAANGSAMSELFAAQLAARNLSARTAAEVARLDAVAHRVTLADGEELACENLILATGLRRRKLDVPGEAEFAGRGVSDSGTRDRARLAGKTICVVGGGDAAVENALLLAEVCPRIFLVHRGESLRARPEFVARLKREPRITLLSNTIIENINGDEYVRSIEIKRVAQGDRVRESLAVDGVLVRIGYEPNSELVRGQVATDEAGYICVGGEHETNVRGVFAVGDVANPHAPTISGAVGAGATVAKVIEARRRAAG